MCLEKKLSSTIFLFLIKMESVTVAYPHLLALQMPTNEGSKVEWSFKILPRGLSELSSIVFDSDQTCAYETTESYITVRQPAESKASQE